MDFGLSDEQRLLQQTVERFLAAENDPAALRRRFDAQVELDLSFWKGFADLGLGGLLVPEPHGGAGLALVDACLVAETLGAAAAPLPFLAHTLAGLAISRGGSDAQKREWLPRLAAGDVLASVALAEAGGRWLPEDWTLAGGAALSGEKEHVAAAADAGLLVVGTAGGGLALVETAGPGVAAEPFAGADRTRRLSRLHLDGAPCEALPGAHVAQHLRDAGLVLLAADAWGGARSCVERSVAYAQGREQFGTTIAHFQAVKHQLAEMALRVEPSRGLVWGAALALDREGPDAERLAALAKAHLTDGYLEVARDAIQVHGGIGYTWECDIQIFFKRAMFDRAFLGSPALHRERAARLARW